MKAKIIATEGIPGNEEFTVTIFTLEADAATSEAELKNLARHAAARYAMTPEGKDCVYGFNWANMINEVGEPAFDSICRELGLRIEFLEGYGYENSVYLDEDLMDGLTALISDIKWNGTFDRTGEPLPSEVRLTAINQETDIAKELCDRYGCDAVEFTVKDCITDRFAS